MKTIAQIAAELQGYDPQALPAEAVLDFLARLVTPVRESQSLPLFEALGKVLADDVNSPLNVPPHDNSAMDGYAFNGRQLQAGQALQLRVVGTAFAGKAWAGKAGIGECVKIMTGAIMPVDFDTVVPQEMVSFAEGNSEHIVIAPGLLAAAELKRWCGKGMLVANEFIHMGVLLASPTPPMAEFIIGMVNAQVHMVKAVKRDFDVAGWVVFPSFPNFLPMATRRLAARLVGQAGCSRLGVLRRFDFNVLQVGFTHVKSLVFRIAQGLRQGSLVQGKLNAVVANTMARRHPTRHQGGPVGHADGGCHVAFIGHPPTAGQCVQVRGLDSGVAIATQMVRAVLVGYEDDEIWGFVHGSEGLFGANTGGFDHVGPFGQIGIHTPG